VRHIPDTVWEPKHNPGLRSSEVLRPLARNAAVRPSGIVPIHFAVILGPSSASQPHPNRYAVLMSRRKSSLAIRGLWRRMVQSPPAEPALLHHGILKGFTVTMAISAIYLALLMIPSALEPLMGVMGTDLTIVTFIAIFVIVIVAVAAYYKKENQAVWNYFVGVLIALGVDMWLGFIWLDWVTIATFIASA